MAISNSNILSPLFIGNGVSTSFPTGFYTAEKDEIKVIVRNPENDTEQELVYGTDYTVTDEGKPAGAHVQLAVPLPENHLMRILLDVPITQELGTATGLDDGKHIPVLDFVKAFDKLTQVYQMIESSIELFGSRPTDTINIEGLPPGGIEQAGFVLGYSTPDGDEIVGMDPSDIFPPVEMSSFGETLVAAPGASEARTLLGLGTLATQNGSFSGTSSGTNTGDQNVFSSIAVPGHDTVNINALGALNITGSGGFIVETDDSTNTVTLTPPESGNVPYVATNYRKTSSTVTFPDPATTPIQLPGMQHTFTPTTSSSRVLIIANFPATRPGVARRVNYFLYKNGVPIAGALGDAAGNRTPATHSNTYELNSHTAGPVEHTTLSFIDVTGTTSPVTYSLWASGANITTLSFFYVGMAPIHDSPAAARPMGSFFVLEI